MLTDEEKKTILRATAPRFRQDVEDWLIETDLRNEYVRLCLAGRAEPFVTRAGDVIFMEVTK